MNSKLSIYDIRGFSNPENGYIEDMTNYAIKGNRSEEDRIELISRTAAISRGKEESNNPTVRYKHLLKEGAFNSPSRPFEFLPVKLDITINSNGVYQILLKDDKIVEFTPEDFINKLGKYGYLEFVGYSKLELKTNMRAVLKAGINYEDVPYNDNCDGFRIFKMQIPMFVFNHVVTHTMLSKESRSDRVVKLKGNGYWLPADIKERMLNLDINERRVTPIEDETKETHRKLMTTIEATDNYEHFVLALAQIPTQHLMTYLKDLGYPREIYQRALLEMRYKETIIGAWENENTWLNFLRERGGSSAWKNWVQKETKQVAITLSKFFDYEEVKNVTEDKS